MNEPSKVSIKALINEENKENSLVSDKNLDVTQQQIFNQNLDK